MNSLLCFIINVLCIQFGWTRTFPFTRDGVSSQRRLKDIEDLGQPHYKQWKRLYQDQEYENEVLKVDSTQAFPIECLHMETLEGDYVYTSDGRKEVCGMYIVGEPDVLVHVDVLSVNADCKQGAIVSFVDGWELQGEYFPSVEDHVLPPEERFAESCGMDIPKRFTAHQNAAVIQFLLPKKGQGFTIRVSFKKINRPCNVVSMYPTGVYTLRNFGRKINCSVAVIYPVSVKILAIDVGQSDKKGDVSAKHTRTKTECEELDNVQLLDGTGLSTSKMRKVLPPICGIISLPVSGNFTLACQSSVVRLVSSGTYYNTITVDFAETAESQLTECVKRK